MRKGRTIIFVFANGKKSAPRKVVLIKSDYKIWDNILIHIGNILDIPEGVKGLCTIFGQPLCSPYEIQHGGYYVAIPFNATFKKMKYLAAKRSDSYHESSPLVTKGAYVSASKTCTSMEGLLGKRRKGKSSGAKDSSEQKKIHRSTKDRQWTDEECECVNDEVGASVKKKRTMDDQREETTGYIEIAQPFDRLEEDTNIPTDVDMTEHQIQSEVYDQTEIFTQTSAICFESICDQENVIIMNEKKFFLLTEEELQHLKDSNIDSQQPFETSQESTQPTQHHFTDQEMEEIRELAGNFVGIITKVSEKMIAKTVFGMDYVSIDSSQDRTSADMDEKVIFFPDTLQPKSPPSDIIEDRLTKSALSKKDKQQADHLKSLRLSLPIGRGTILDLDESEDEIIPQKKVSLHSPPVEMSDSLMEEIEEQYRPMTPARDISKEERRISSERDNEDKENEEEEEQENGGSYIPFFGLRRDSIGIPLISKLYGARKESLDEDEDETVEGDGLYAKKDEDIKIEEEEQNDYEEDEWKKLDIIEDMDLGEDKVESFTDHEVKEKRHIEFEEEAIDVEELKIETSELIEELPQMIAEEMYSGLVDEIISKLPQRPEEDDKETKLSEDITSDHLKKSSSTAEEIAENQVVVFRPPQILEVVIADIADKEEITSDHSHHSNLEIEDFGKIEETTSAHLEGSKVEIEETREIDETKFDHLESSHVELEETKEIEETTSDHLEISNAEMEETKDVVEIMSDKLQTSVEAVEDVQASGDITSDRSQTSNVEIEEKEASGDIFDRAEIEERVASADVAEEQPQDVFSDKSPETTEDIQDTKEFEDMVSEEQKIVSKYVDEEIYPDVERTTTVTEEKIIKKKEKIISEKPKKDTKQAATKAKKRHPSEAGGKEITKIDLEQVSLTSTKGSSSHYYGQKDLQTPEKIYGSLLETSGELARNSDGSLRPSLSSEPVLTQKSKVGSYCVTLNSWISMKVEECNETIEKNTDKVGQIKTTKQLKKDKPDQKRNVKSEFEEERRRSLLNFMKMRIEVALSNKIPELRQPKESSN
ncbi:hypothetical protein WA026_010585 [Henosepilachna vigintioctopunctata]